MNTVPNHPPSAEVRLGRCSISPACGLLRSSGFTLIEVLVVTGIIMLLAGMGFGVFTMVRNQAKLIQCTNNLKNLGTGIKAFQLESPKNEFPGHLWELFELGAPMAGENRVKMVVCPFDLSKGTNPYMGRPKPPSRWDDLSSLHLNEKPMDLNAVSLTSYVYEFNRDPISNTTIDPAYFYDGRWHDPNNVAENNLGNLNPPLWGKMQPLNPTWAEAKINSYTSYVKGAGGTLIKPRANAFPVIRDFNHHKWSGGLDDDAIKKAFNLSMAFTVFWSIPPWENDLQP
jgi:type II secretory pathway pseudopilin PulG